MKEVNRCRSSVPFITFSQEQGYKIHQQAISLVNNLTQSSSCSVLSIVGKAKTGKSYFLNKLASLLQEESILSTNYFPVNDGVGAGTFGIEMMPIVSKGQTIILLDMEGLGNLSSNSDSEGKLFALALLLSSVMIYNNVGPLDLQGLQGLGILIEITKLLGGCLNDNKQKLELPSLIVALRDFALSLENEVGQKISAQQYLEEALKEQRVVNANSNKNQIKKAIKNIFSERNCFTFSLPSQAVLITSKSLLRTEFAEELQGFGKNIKENIKNHLKCLNGQKLSPSGWLSFAQDLTSLINKKEKEGTLKLQGLLFQAYRRQQGSIRDRFSLFSQTLLKKAQTKSRQMMSINEILSEISESQLISSAERGSRQLQQIQEELQSSYVTACREIEEMVRKQSGCVIQGLIDFNSPSLAKMKDFSELYNLKQVRMTQLENVQLQLQNSIQQLLERHRQTKAEKQDNQKFKRIMEQINLCQNQRQADSKYINFVNTLRSDGVSLDSKAFESNLLKLEVAYLRRKLECSNRQQIQYMTCSQEKKDSQEEERQILKEKVENVFMTAKCISNKSDFQSQNSKLFSFCPKEVTPFNFGEESTKKAFLVPYLTIELDQINVEIVRTLVKQDNKGMNYLQYVMEVVLIDRRWVFNRRWKDFNQLHNILSQLYPPEMLPEFKPGSIPLDIKLLSKAQQIQSRRSCLQEYLRGLLGLWSVRNSRIMQKFLKVNKQYIPFL